MPAVAQVPKNAAVALKSWALAGNTQLSVKKAITPSAVFSVQDVLKIHNKQLSLYSMGLIPCCFFLSI